MNATICTKSHLYSSGAGPDPAAFAISHMPVALLRELLLIT